MFCTIHDDSERFAAQRQKEQLIAMITHDLRSPLMTVEHVTEMFLDGELGRITKETALAKDAQESAGDMMASINKILKAGKDQADVMR